ncbi:MAG: ACP S-malonyltransferase [Chloroflexi bacterium]|nr:ACP S-malonyltransferase [Chloroflexota bacterium]
MDAKKPRLALVFPGQGSQEVGMGSALYESSPPARAIFREADAILDFPLSRLCFQGPEEELKRTINAQPAIFTVSLAYLRTAKEANPAEAFHPHFVAGHSLGEYTALVAAGVLEFGDALRLVRERGRLMEEAGSIARGGMAALIGLDEATVEEVCQETGAEIANLNSAQQIVISGSREALARAVDLARARGARHAIPLEVSAAFHSSLMGPAREGMAKALFRMSLRHPFIPIVANSTGQPVTTAEEVKAELLTQICSCVQWQRSVEYMVEAGVTTFLEVGPGRVLSGLIRRINNQVQVANIGDVSSSG